MKWLPNLKIEGVTMTILKYFSFGTIADAEIRCVQLPKRFNIEHFFLNLISHFFVIRR